MKLAKSAFFFLFFFGAGAGVTEVEEGFCSATGELAAGVVKFVRCVGGVLLSGLRIIGGVLRFCGVVGGGL
jgi:hypothetical protein